MGFWFPRRSWTDAVCKTVALVVAVTAIVGAAEVADARTDVLDSANRVFEQYEAELEDLAAWCEENSLDQAARKTRDCARPEAPDEIHLPILPTKLDANALPEDAPEKTRVWHDRWMALRKKTAQSLYTVAQEAAVADRASLAMDVALAALYADPDHEALRRLFGYRQYEGQWHTPWEIRMLRNGFVWHPKFGWLPETYVSQYERGMRRYRGRWITAEQDAEMRSGDIRRGWTIETEHYVIRTNHSLEEGVRLATELERFYGVWRQLFTRFFANRNEIAAMFAGRGGRQPERRHAVVHFRSHDEFIGALEDTFGEMAKITTGLYLEETRKFYTFAGQSDYRRTLRHEGTHQLFHETCGPSRSVGQQANFWAIEGVAMYMESLRQEGDFHVLGGFGHSIRLQAAQHRLLKDDFYIPWRQFASWDMKQFQSHPRIATIYSQAAGMTHFLIHYDGGRYRDALIATLIMIYNGQDDASTLFRLTRQSPDALDAQYREFLESNGRAPSEG